MLAPDQSPFPDNPTCRLCITKPCRQLFTGRVYPGKMIFVHHSEFLSLPCHKPNFSAGNEENGEEAALTDDIVVTTGQVTISNPRWEPIEEAEARGDPQVPMMGDKVRLLADVKNYPSGAPVSFDIYDVTDSTPLRITTVKGMNENGKAAVEWTVEDPQKRGNELKLQFEAGAKSKYTQKADLPWHDIIRCDFVEMPDVLFHHNSAVPCLDTDGMLLGALTAAFEFSKNNPDKEAVIFGHADTSGDPSYNYDISQWRAEGINALIDNKKDAWLDIVDLASKVEDYQTILSALTATHGWDCDPGKIDNIPGDKTNAAVKAFQEQYNAKYGANLKPDGIIGPKTWEALFIVITDIVKKTVKNRLSVEAPPPLTYGYGGKGIYACGESFPIDSADKGDYKSDANRRVEIVFFDKDKAPELTAPANKKKVVKKEAPVYDRKKTEKKIIVFKEKKNYKKKELAIKLVIDDNGFFKPIVTMACKVIIDGFEKLYTTDDSGMLSLEINGNEKSGEILCKIKDRVTIRLPIVFKKMPSANTVEGASYRLKTMGVLYNECTDPNNHSFILALNAFQAKNHLEITGKLDGATVQALSMWC